MKHIVYLALTIVRQFDDFNLVIHPLHRIHQTSPSDLGVVRFRQIRPRGRESRRIPDRAGTDTVGRRGHAREPSVGIEPTSLAVAFDYRTRWIGIGLASSTSRRGGGLVRRHLLEDVGGGRG